MERVYTYMEPEQKDRLEQIAQDRGQSLSELIRRHSLSLIDSTEDTDE